MPWSSNATFLVNVGTRAAPRRSTSRSAASARCGTSSPACTAGRSRPTCSARRWASASCRRRCCATRPARRGLGAVVRRRRPPAALLHDPRAAPRAARPAARDGGARHPRQQHRPQERPLPARRRATASVWGIDHGLCFAPEFKLRTVIWEFAGEPDPRRLARPRRRSCARRVPLEIAALLDEPRSKRSRAAPRGASRSGSFPTDPSGRRYPWPLV